ncbi:MAG: hypothetical protein F4046_00485, partial [Acidimicrobiaceae bacterium]|nr:hypothetical protein [Acidimicrobiaceae bacterium]
MAIPAPLMVLSHSEMQQIALGYRPVYDDRWLAFMEDYRLFLHRSWERPVEWWTFGLSLGVS